MREWARRRLEGSWTAAWPRRRRLALLVVGSLLASILAIGATLGRQLANSQDRTQYVHMVQGPGVPNQSDRQVFMRYPLGRVGLWSRAAGEIADSVTRGVRLYPTVDRIVNKDVSTDWRSTIAATPSKTDITYRSDVPAKGSSVALTVTPHVSVYQYHFNDVSSFGAVAIQLRDPYPKADWIGARWTRNTIRVVDDRTVEATLGNDDRTIYYYIKFSRPAVGWGTFTGSAVNDRATSNTAPGDGDGGYLEFDRFTPDVTAAVALSNSSIARAQQLFIGEFSAFDFAAASQRLKHAWNVELSRIDVQQADQLTKEMLYTGLYTVYANVIDATDGSPYAPYAAAYGSPVLTIGSSPDWALIGGGFLRSQYDMARSVYPLLTLIDPRLMTDILHTYQAQYDLNGVLLGNWDPYCARCWRDTQWGFFGGMFLRAYLQKVPGVDYDKAKAAIADSFGGPHNYLSQSGYLTKGYIPADGGPDEYMSRGLEFSTQIEGLALLANALGDRATYKKFIDQGQNYRRSWDPVNRVFRGKNSDESWAAMNTGFFEGSDRSYAFDVPHDPLGLVDLYGDDAMTSQIGSLLTPNTDYNDYQPTYQVLPIYSNSPSTAQEITRERFVPQFRSLNIWEAWRPGSDVYYTDNAGALVAALLGLYPIQAPGAQWVITSPSVRKAVVHGIKDTTIEAVGNAARKTYISSIDVDGAGYPSYFISGRRLVAANTTITLRMTDAPTRLGSMYVTGTEAEAMGASTDGRSYLEFTNGPIGVATRADIYATRRPSQVLVNSIRLDSWTYDGAADVVHIQGIPAGNVTIRFGVLV